jgi:hypothetical protein
MNREIKFEEKYKNLKSKFMESVDLAFRLGFEQGQQKAAQDQMAQQQQQAEMEAAQQAQMQGGQPGQPGEEGQDQQAQPGQEGPPGAGAPPQENPMGSELDQHLNELEGMLGKSELSTDDLKKTIGQIKQLRELKKSHEAIKGIGLALHTPAFKVSQQATHNLTNTAKQSLHIQQKIVEDVFKSWDEEEKRTVKEIGSTLEVEGLISK